MSTLCSDSVLTGQEGTITFKPPGTSVCVRDHEPFGEFDIAADGTLGAPAVASKGNSIKLECGAKFLVGDIITFQEEDGGNLDSALAVGVPFASAPDVGAVTELGSFVAGSGYGASGTYNGVTATGGSPTTAATLNITTNAGGGVETVAIATGGAGYVDTDQLSVAETDIGGTGSGTGFTVEVESVYVQKAQSGASYYVVRAATKDGVQYIAVSLAENGTPIQMEGDGGTGTADKALPAHINITLADFISVCAVREFSIDITRDELDITTLPCKEDSDSDGCAELAEFRQTQAGFATATGSMTVYFSCDQTNIGNRLLQSSILKSQQGAKVRLYVCAKYDNGELDNINSLYIDADITITGMSFSVNPDDATTAELNFSVRKMNSMFGLSA